MQIPGLALRHLNDQVIWDSPAPGARWPVFQANAFISFKRDGTLIEDSRIYVETLLVIDNHLRADFCQLVFAGEISASHDLLPSEESLLFVTVYGQPDIGHTISDQAQFATHPGETKVFENENGISWLGDGLGIVTLLPISLPPYHGNATGLVTAFGNVASTPGWPFYGVVDGNANGHYNFVWQVGKLSTPILSLSGYRRLLINMRVVLGEDSAGVDQMTVAGKVVASLFEITDDKFSSRGR